jgi:hypothetical protein
MRLRWNASLKSHLLVVPLLITHRQVELRLFLFFLVLPLACFTSFFMAITQAGSDKAYAKNVVVKFVLTCITIATCKGVSTLFKVEEVHQVSASAGQASLIAAPTFKLRAGVLLGMALLATPAPRRAFTGTTSRLEPRHPRAAASAQAPHPCSGRRHRLARGPGSVSQTIVNKRVGRLTSAPKHITSIKK